MAILQAADVNRGANDKADELTKTDSKHLYIIVNILGKACTIIFRGAKLNRERIFHIIII